MKMTNEEKIDQIRNFIALDGYKFILSVELKESLFAAIKALEQTELNPSYNGVKTELKPCEDCISRKEALRHRHIIYDDDGVGYSVVRVDEIEQLPSVTPKAESEGY